MINDLFVAASVKGTEERLNAACIPYANEEKDAYRNYMKAWDSLDDKESFMRQTGIRSAFVLTDRTVTLIKIHLQRCSSSVRTSTGLSECRSRTMHRC